MTKNIVPNDESSSPEMESGKQEENSTKTVADNSNAGNDFLSGLNVFKFLNENNNNDGSNSNSEKNLLAPQDRPSTNNSSPTNNSHHNPEIESLKASLDDDDDEVRRAAAIAVAISTSHLTPKEAIQKIGQDERQKQLLEAAKRKKQQNPGWALNVNNLQQMFQANNSSDTNVTGQQWTWPGQQTSSKSVNTEVPVTKDISIAKDKGVLIGDQNDQVNVSKNSNTKSAKTIQHTMQAGQVKSKQEIEDGLQGETNTSSISNQNEKKDSTSEDDYSPKQRAPINESDMKSDSPSTKKQNDTGKLARSISAMDSHFSQKDDKNEISPKLKSKKSSLNCEVSKSLETIIWKRRSGLGQLSTNAWEKRKLVLQGSKLVYYKIDEDGTSMDSETSQDLPQQQQQQQQHQDKKLNIWEQAAANIALANENWNKTLKQLNIPVPNHNDSNDPRGMLDVTKDQITVAAICGQGGAPTPFVISIRSGLETKWRVCFDSNEEQLKWLKALTDIIVRKSIEEYNYENKSSHSDAKKWSLMNDNTFSFSPEEIDDVNGVTSRNNEIESQQKNKDNSFEKPIWNRKPNLSLDGLNFYIFICLLNVAFITIHNNALFIYIAVVILVNGSVWAVLPQVIQDCELKTKDKEKKRSEKLKIDPEKVKPLKPDFIPKCGTTAIQLDVSQDPINKINSLPSWRRVSGSTLKVRSVGYMSSRVKIPSPNELYECVAVDIYSSNKRLPSFGNRVDISSLLSSSKLVTEKTKIYCPDIFIVTIAIPTEQPKLTKAETDGEGLNISIYLKIKEQSKKILEAVSKVDDQDESRIFLESLDDVSKQQINAIKLFNEWCRRSPTEPKFQARFKLIPLAINLEEIGIPSYISKYSNKPVLIKRAGVTGFLTSHVDASVMEFDISLHPFPFIAKQAFCYLHQNFFAKMIATIGFVIEGRSDDELPEAVIGAAQICYPNPSNIIDANDLFSGISKPSVEVNEELSNEDCKENNP